MNRASWFCVFSALATFSASLAGAQGIENTPDTMVYSVEGGVRFDDNRDAVKENKESMTTLSFSPGVQLNMDDLITTAFLMYKPSLLWRDNPREDQNATELYHLAEANVEHLVSYRTKVGASDRYEMTDDPNVTAGGVAVRADASYWLNEAKGWMLYGLSDRVQVDLDGTYKMKRYIDKTFADQADEDRIVANGALRYKLDPANSTFGFVGFDQPSYKSSERGDYLGYLLGAGLTREFTDDLKGTVAAGYKLLDYSDAVTGDEGMPFFQMLAEYRVSLNLALTAQADYSLEPSDREFYSSKEYTRLLLRGVYSITESMSADAQVVYANGVYSKDSAIQQSADLQTLSGGDDTLMDYQVGFTFRPKARRYYSRVAYEYEDWTSDVRESFARNTVSATMGMEF